MKLDIPNLITTLPTIGYWKSVYHNESYRAKIAYTIASKIYWRTIISERQNHRCCYCGIRTTEIPGHKHSATVEHVIPKSCGGSDSPENYALACYDCNLTRGNMPYDVFICNRNQKINNDNVKKELRRQIRAAGGKINKHTKPSRLQRKLDVIEVRKAIAMGKPNMYAVDTRKYKMYLRYSLLAQHDTRENLAA